MYCSLKVILALLLGIQIPYTGGNRLNAVSSVYPNKHTCKWLTLKFICVRHCCFWTSKLL